MQLFNNQYSSYHSLWSVIGLQKVRMVSAYNRFHLFSAQFWPFSDLLLFLVGPLLQWHCSFVLSATFLYSKQVAYPPAISPLPVVNHLHHCGLQMVCWSLDSSISLPEQTLFLIRQKLLVQPLSSASSSSSSQNPQIIQRSKFVVAYSAHFDFGKVALNFCSW